METVTKKTIVINVNTLRKVNAYLKKWYPDFRIFTEENNEVSEDSPIFDSIISKFTEGIEYTFKKDTTKTIEDLIKEYQAKIEAYENEIHGYTKEIYQLKLNNGWEVEIEGMKEERQLIDSKRKLLIQVIKDLQELL